MAGKADTLREDFLDFFLQEVAFPSYGSTLYISLHTGDPGPAGDQTTSEATYTDYDRVAVTRDNTEWHRTDNVASNMNLISFPTATGGSETITHIGIGTDASGAGTLLASGAVTTPLDVSTGITPQILADALTVTET